METPTVEEIQDRFHRALTADEERMVAAWLEDARDELYDTAGLDLEERLASGLEPRLEGRVRRTIRAAVLRRLQNPQGRRQFSYTVDDATVSETLASETLSGVWFTDDELSRLLPDAESSDSFTIRTDAHLPDPPIYYAPFRGW